MNATDWDYRNFGYNGAPAHVREAADRLAAAGFPVESLSVEHRRDETMGDRIMSSTWYITMDRSEVVLTPRGWGFYLDGVESPDAEQGRAAWELVTAC